MNPPICGKCKVRMTQGIAIKNGLSGMNDFSGDKTCCTVHLDPKKAEVINCWKCPKCGYSIYVEA